MRQPRIRWRPNRSLVERNRWEGQAAQTCKLGEPARDLPPTPTRESPRNLQHGASRADLGRKRTSDRPFHPKKFQRNKSRSVSAGEFGTKLPASNPALTILLVSG